MVADRAVVVVGRAVVVGRRLRGLVAAWLAGAVLLAGGCFDVAAQVRERGRANLAGRWRVVAYRSAEAVEVRGELAFTSAGVMRERLRFAGAGLERAAGRRERDRRFELEPLGPVGAYQLRLEDGQRLPLTFTPDGRLLIAWPAEVGRGWARLPARVELVRAPERVRPRGSRARGGRGARPPEGAGR